MENEILQQYADLLTDNDIVFDDLGNIIRIDYNLNKEKFNDGHFQEAITDLSRRNIDSIYHSGTTSPTGDSYVFISLKK